MANNPIPGSSPPYSLMPSVLAPLVGQGGLVTSPWAQFFASLVGQPPPIAAVPLGASPFGFTASQQGTLAIEGGAVSAVSLLRGKVTILLPATAGLIPMSQGDVVTVTYSAAPTISFIPG